MKSQVSFPREWEFNRVHRNAECLLLEINIRYPDQSSPIDLQEIVAQVLNRFPKETRQGLLGTMYVVLRNRWYNFYSEKETISTNTVAPPPERR